MPVRGYGVSTPYRKVGSWWKACGWHTGVDIAAPRGTPIYAPIAGTIRHRNYGSCFGSRQFVISPSAGQPFAAGEVFFAHVLSRLPDGTRVEAGQKISEVGSEGCSSGPHLHLEYHSVKQQWSCGVMRDPAPILAWQPSGGGGTPPSGDWKYPSGTKVHQKYLKWRGHEQNADKKSTSIGAWQDMLNRHSLQGGATLPITEAWHSMTAAETQKCQTQHVPPADQPLEAVFVGPKQFEHVKADTKSPYVWVPDDSAPPPVVPPPTDKPARPAQSYPNAIWDPIAKSGGGWFTGLRPFARAEGRKITLHTTETAVKPNWQGQQSGIPHFTINTQQNTVWQHLPLDTAAYTLRGQSGGPGNSPNSGAGINIQIEMIGYTKDVAGWSDERYLAVRLLCEWIAKECGVPMVCPLPFVSPQRQTWEAFVAARGIVGHVHVPYNDHTDPTGWDTARFLATGTKPPDPPVEPPEPPPGDYVTRDEIDALAASWDAWRRTVAEAILRDPPA